MATVKLFVEDIADILESYDSVRLYRASSRTGSYSLVTTVTLVADTRLYTYEDSSGAATDWYKSEYYNSSTSAISDRSDPWPADQPVTTTLAQCRQDGAGEMGLFYSGTTTGAGNGGGTTVVAATSMDDALTGEEYVGGWLYITSGAYLGEVRRVTGYDNTTGTFTVSRAFSGQIASSVTWEWYGYLKPSEWNDCVNDVLARLLYEEPWDFVGAGGDTVRYPLPYTLQNLHEVLEVLSRDDLEGDDASWTPLPPGTWWPDRISGTHSIVFATEPSEGDVYRARILRPYDPLSSDSDRTAADPTVVEKGVQVQACLRILKKLRPNQDRKHWERQLQLVQPAWNEVIKLQRPRTMAVKRIRQEIEVD